MLDKSSLEILQQTIEKLESGFHNLPSFDQYYKSDNILPILSQTAERMNNNYPYFHPLYAGQMLKPPHPIARLAYAMAMYINPNNHALDGGRASSAMEKEAVANIAKLFGWNQHLGHLTSGGTMANLEALWIAGQIHPGKYIIASASAHYTHSRISSVLKLPFTAIETDNIGRMDISHLESVLQKHDVGTVVVTLGTTSTGSLDPLSEILQLQAKYHFRIHVDAAYGGYFILADNLTDYAKAQFQALAKVDSIVIDPHKHGLQPYGCGCVLFQDAEVGKYYKHDSPYTYFSSKELHLGEISLECSRAGASAVALWATMQLLPLVPKGEFSQGLARCHDAAIKLYDLLRNDELYYTAFPPELDIIIWTPTGKSITDISMKSRLIFELAAQHNFHLALADLPVKYFQFNAEVIIDSNTVTCLRSCLMKPEHLDWVDEIYRIVKNIAEEL